MRVLFVHEVSYRTKFVFEMHEFPELLARRGDAVSFLEFPEDTESWRPRLKFVSGEIAGRAYPDARITLHTPSSFGRGIIGRIFGVFAAFPAASRLLRRDPPDVVVLLSVPTSGWQFIRLAQRLRVPVVFRALDVSHLLRTTSFAWLIRIAEKYVYKHATVVSANNPALARYCVELSGRTGPTVVNLPPLDVEHFGGPLSKAPLRDYGIPTEAKVIMYMGTFFRFAGLQQALRDFATLAGGRGDRWFVLVGQGEMEDELRALTIELGIVGQVVFTGRVDYLDLGKILRSADVTINPFNSEFLTNVALPHKVFQYMASGVPVVSTSLEGIRGVVGDAAGITWVEGTDSPTAAALTLLELAPEVRHELGRKQQEKIAQLLDLERITNEFVDTLELAQSSS